MFAGLILTSISAAVMQTALFQRKSRSGWLEELDGIRQDALDQHDGGVAPVGEADDIWTDLRDGGEYEDPHEISSLYATDATPDLPVSKPVARAAKAPARAAKAKPAKAPADAPPPPPPAGANGALPPPPAATLPPPPAPVADAPLPPPPAAEVPLAPPPAPVDVPVAAEPEVERPGTGEAPGAPQYDDQIWVQPAPHPIRPSEMWHPAELSPPPLPEESFEPVLEERVASADLMDPTYRSVPEPAPAPVAPVDAQTVAELEQELAAVADLTVAPVAPAPAPAAPAPMVGGLVSGPVGRRVRRDRPAERPKASLPPPEAHVAPVAPADRGEQSPLPAAPLPPAALPTRSNRLPGLETLPATPSSVVPPRPVAEPAAPVQAPAPVAAAEPVAPVAPVVPEPAPVAAPAPVEPVAAAEPAPVPEPPAPAPIAIGADGMVEAPGTIVRIGGERRAHASGSPAGVVVGLEEGWCWASPGEGAASSLRIDLPTGALTVEPGATALAVVEADRSVFILVAAGRTHLGRGDDGAAIDRGTIVMIDPSGVAQTDVATDAEIEADPIVAENLALDAEL